MCGTRLKDDAVKDRISAMRTRMRKAIKKTGKTVDSFCKDNGIERTAFYNKNAYPSAYVILLVAEQCNVTTDYIMRGVEK